MSHYIVRATVKREINPTGWKFYILEKKKQSSLPYWVLVMCVGEYYQRCRRHAQEGVLVFAHKVTCTNKSSITICWTDEYRLDRFLHITQPKCEVWVINSCGMNHDNKFGYGEPMSIFYINHVH